MPRQLTTTLAMRTLFFTASALVLLIALVPGGAVSETSGLDKLHHFLAFYALSLLGFATFLQARTIAVTTSLIAFGAFIELLQGVTAWGRSMDLIDWLADVVGITFALAPILVARYRISSRS